MRRQIFAAVLMAGSIVLLAMASTTTDYPVLVSCTSSGQLCEPPAVVPVSVGAGLEVEFTTSLAHCSDIRVYISVDNQLKHTSGFLGPGASTGVVNVGPVTPGPHTIDIQAEGRLGGCNVGNLIAWAGTLSVTTSPYAGTPGEENCHGDSVSALAAFYGGLRNAAEALGFESVAALQEDIRAYCRS